MSAEDWYCSVKVHSIVLPNEITIPHMHVCMYLNFIEHTLKSGESIFRQKGNLVANIWQDKKVVSVISINCQPTGPTKVSREQKDGTTEMVTCPPNVVKYNKFMGVWTEVINSEVTTGCVPSPGNAIATFCGSWWTPAS